MERYFVPALRFKNRYSNNYAAIFEGKCGRNVSIRYEYDRWEHPFEYENYLSAGDVAKKFDVKIRCFDKLPIDGDDYIRPFSSQAQGCPCIDCIATVTEEMHEDLLHVKAQAMATRMFNYHQNKYGHVKN